MNHATQDRALPSVEVVPDPDLDEVKAALVQLTSTTSGIERGVIALIDEVVRLRQSIATDAHRQSRDIGYASDLAAVASSAAFAQAHFPTAARCPDVRATLRLATSMVAVPGMALEFGVASGSSLAVIAEQLQGRRIYGFDVFTGLPEDWRTGFPAGAFAQRPPVVAGAKIIEGLFEDVLPGFMARHGDPVAFLHLDADLYSSTVTALEHVGPRLVEGSVVIFDEYFNYPNWQEHEHKAWQEFVDRTGVEFRYEAYTADHEQLVVRITKAPRIG